MAGYVAESSINQPAAGWNTVTAEYNVFIAFLAIKKKLSNFLKAAL